MQLVVNDRVVKREARIGAVALGVTFFLLLVGLLASSQAELWSKELGQWAPIGITYGIVLVGMGLYYVGNARVRRYGPQHRQDTRLRQLLKGLDDKYALYAFASRALPDYILVGPSGVFVLTARPQTGELTCREDRWTGKGGAGRKLFTVLYGNPIGSPSHDTAQGVQKVQAFLRERLGAENEPLVSGLIVFTNEPVRLRSDRCAVTATTSKELRRVVGKARGRLNGVQIAQVRAAFGEALAP